MLIVCKLSPLYLVNYHTWNQSLVLSHEKKDFGDF